MKPSIAVVGSVNMDLVFRTPRMPALGETIEGQEFLQIPGGKGANQAVAAARMGAAVKFIGRVGSDGFGRHSQQCLQQDAIDTAQLTVAEGIATGVAGILVDASGNNSIVLAAGANATLAHAHIEAARDTIASARLLICQLETPLVSVTEAIRIAHTQGVTVILNPAPARALPPELLAQIDYLILNETEASQLSGVSVSDQTSARSACQKLLETGVGTVILTMGEHGVCISARDLWRHIPAIQVDAVDTTAAGDTFVGAFAVGVAQGLSIEQASTQAQYAAALTVTRLGAQTSIPAREEVEQFMHSRANI